ncbi:MAG: hypothetical protein E4H15_07635, partial [Syntrophobacterales bacterium]
MAPNSKTNFSQEENINHESLIRIIRILLEQVKNRSKKTAFNQRLNSAVLNDNSPALNSLMTDLGNYITNMSNRTARESMKKEPVYEEPPTFDRAVADFILKWCADLDKFPDLNEYYASVETTLFEEIDKPYSPRPERDHRPHPERDPRPKKEKEMKEKRSFETIVKKDMVVISADTQSGKTKAMICAGIKGMLKGKTPVFVTRNVTGDAEQLQMGCENFSNILEAHLTKHGVVERKFKIETIRGDSLDKPSCGKSASDAFDGKVLKMIICLGNAIQLRRVLD